MSKQFWGILILVVVVLGGLFYFTNKHNPTSPSSNKTSSVQPTSHIMGQGKAGVTLVEYGDYECPYCGQFYPIVKSVASQYSQQIYFQFRNLPLTQIHQNAFIGARAAEAAGLQGKFWEMHDLLYQNQSQWVQSADPTPIFSIYAGSLGLNINQFKTDMLSSKVDDLINADLAAFNKTGAQLATPTFFLDGKQIQPGYSVADFQKYINAEISAKAKK